jgi:hypothetical protein
VRIGKDERCVPATASARVVLGAGCAAQIDVVLVPERTCTPTAFATLHAATDDDPGALTFHAIGDALAEPMFWQTGSTCEPFVPEPGVVAHRLGPALPPDAFPAAHRYGER